MKSNRQQLGLLIELMMVASIIVVLMVVLMTYVFPSEDRQCRLEAERRTLSHPYFKSSPPGLLPAPWWTFQKALYFVRARRNSGFHPTTLASQQPKIGAYGKTRLCGLRRYRSVADQKSGRAFVISQGPRPKAPSSCSLQGRHSIQWSYPRKR